MPSVLITPVVLDNCVANFDKLCHIKTETPIVKSNSLIDLGAPTELKATKIDPCDLIVQSGLDHIKLVKYDEVLAKISHANSLYSSFLDPLMPLSHATNKIAEITCLSSMKSICAPKLTFNLIGKDYVDNEFLVSTICITCYIPNSPSLGWFNDEKSPDTNRCLTYTCKPSRNSNLNVQQRRRVKMDDVYIYNMYSFSILSLHFQNKQR